jgi:hypothetical protein
LIEAAADGIRSGEIENEEVIGCAAVILGKSNA